MTIRMFLKRPRVMHEAGKVVDVVKEHKTIDLDLDRSHANLYASLWGLRDDLEDGWRCVGVEVVEG